MIKIIIPLPPVTKKNHQQIVKVNGKIQIIPSKQYKQYEKDCMPFLKPIWINYPVNVKALYYMATRRKVDLCNLHEALCDVLTAYNCRIISSMDGSRVLYDKDNPRTEVYIERVEIPD